MTFEMRAKDYDAATATSRAALVDDPRCIPAHLTIAQILTERREYDAALEELELALALASETERANLWRQAGYIYEKQHHWVQAEIAYRNAGDADAVMRVLHNQTVTGVLHSCPSVLDEESVRRDRAVIVGRPDAVPPR